MTSVPNYNGSLTQTPNTLILHAIGEWFMVDESLLRAHDFITSIGLSAHYYIYPNGEVIQQRELTQGAYHAKGHNRNSIGVEFCVPGIYSSVRYPRFLDEMKINYVSDLAYESALTVCRDAIAQHSIKTVTTHTAVDPNRKKDPGTGFPLQRFLNDLDME